MLVYLQNTLNAATDDAVGFAIQEDIRVTMKYGKDQAHLLLTMKQQTGRQSSAYFQIVPVSGILGSCPRVCREQVERAKSPRWGNPESTEPRELPAINYGSTFIGAASIITPSQNRV